MGEGRGPLGGCCLVIACWQAAVEISLRDEEESDEYDDLTTLCKREKKHVRTSYCSRVYK